MKRLNCYRQKRATTAEVVKLLPHFDLGQSLRQPLNFVAGNLGMGVAHVQICGIWWSVADNGAEIMVGKVNATALHAVPKMDDRGYFNAATIARWAAKVIRGEEIDYGYQLDNSVERTIKAVQQSAR